MEYILSYLLQKSFKMAFCTSYLAVDMWTWNTLRQETLFNWRHAICFHKQSWLGIKFFKYPLFITVWIYCSYLHQSRMILHIRERRKHLRLICIESERRMFKLE
ncbi:uncharacterized protein LOC130826287 isoform X2 [Amaranthus tricolor]|uniref:uncharacterized protein LOC130826287 isoform X2 n=1 Tax=Amaranthus tricolor TaxID=29722 RepID=UPI0025892C87|nr:uncharacterized protein LOC130826287 isoform X2 [Amaranthus tricolor]